MDRFKKSVILVVEDDPTTQKVISQQLSKLNVGRIDVAGDGSEALRCLDQRPYDLILCDIRMQPMGGFDFCTSLRRAVGRRFEPRRANTPIIFMTSSADQHNVLKAKQAGAQGYLVKPVDDDVLEKRLNRALPA
ncbi:response regulator [Yunchengibacter salinarum]|uniref:response regulator n=1 Tax=Yunchengibacter salinarum TaxID=3133399 RepID=UPI0035B68BA7